MQFSAPSPMFSFLLYDTDWDRLCTIFLLCRLCSLLSSARGSDSKESTCNAGDAGLIPGLGRSPGEGHGNALQYSCLENPMNRGARQSTVHGLAKSQTWLSDRARIIQSVAFPRLAEPVSLETPAPASWPPLLRDLGSRPTGPLLWAAEFWYSNCFLFCPSWSDGSCFHWGLSLWYLGVTFFLFQLITYQR